MYDKYLKEITVWPQVQDNQVFLNNERVTDKVNLSNFTRSYQVGLSG